MFIYVLHVPGDTGITGSFDFEPSLTSCKGGLLNSGDEVSYIYVYIYIHIYTNKYIYVHISSCKEGLSDDEVSYIIQFIMRD
jgi:hypothetical protein